MGVVFGVQPMAMLGCRIVAACDIGIVLGHCSGALLRLGGGFPASRDVADITASRP
jgi:hypothetical protein